MRVNPAAFVCEGYALALPAAAMRVDDATFFHERRAWLDVRAAMRIETAAFFGRRPTLAGATASMWVEDATLISPELDDEVQEPAEGIGHLGVGGLPPERRGAEGYGEKEGENETGRVEAAHGVPFRKAAPERAALPAWSGLSSDMVPWED